MVYINIPYISENNRIDKSVTKKELELLDISESAKSIAYEAIYNLNPRGVDFNSKSEAEALLLETALKKLGVPYRKSAESEYYIDQDKTR